MTKEQLVALRIEADRAKTEVERLSLQNISPDPVKAAAQWVELDLAKRRYTSAAAAYRNALEEFDGVA